MTKRLEIYKCDVCGNIVEIMNGAGPKVVCCGKPMNLMEEQTADWKNEKHVPVVEAIDGGFKVTVGSTLHPMEDEHYIEWIQVIADGKSYREYLKPGQEPIAEFRIDAKEITAREYCNKHGLWKTS